MSDETAGGGTKASLEKIVSTCREVLRRDPRNWAAYRDLGVALLELGRCREAADAFENAHDLNRRDTESLHLAAVAYAEAKDYDRAISLWRQVLRADPRHAAAHFFLGKVYAIKSMWDPAIYEFKKSIEIKPDAKPPMAYTYLAEVYLARGKPDLAVSCLETARDIAPEDPNIRLNLGAAYLDLGRNEAALAESLEASRLGAASATAELNAGMALMRLGRPKEAAAAYERGLLVDDRDPDLYLNLGEAHLASGDLDRAVEAWRKALEVAPNHANAHYNLGVAHFRQGRAAEAEAEWKRTLEIEPRHSRARVAMATLHASAGDYDKAIAAWKPLLETHKDNPDVLAGLAELYLRSGDLDLALDYSRQAVIAVPGFPRAEFILGVTLARRGQAAEALEAIRKSVARGQTFLKTQVSTIRACLDEVTLKALEREADKARYSGDPAMVKRIRELKQAPG